MLGLENDVASSTMPKDEPFNILKMLHNDDDGDEEEYFEGIFQCTRKPYKFRVRQIIAATAALDDQEFFEVNRMSR